MVSRGMQNKLGVAVRKANNANTAKTAMRGMESAAKGRGIAPEPAAKKASAAARLRANPSALRGKGR